MLSDRTRERIINEIKKNVSVIYSKNRHQAIGYVIGLNDSIPDPKSEYQKLKLPYQHTLYTIKTIMENNNSSSNEEEYISLAYFIESTILNDEISDSIKTDKIIEFVKQL